MEDLPDAGHQHQHTHKAVHHRGDARQQADCRGDNGFQLCRRHFRQKHGGHKADGDAQNDSARRAVNAGQDKRQNAELRRRAVGVPHRAEQEFDKADLPDGRDTGNNEIYGDQQHAAHRYQSHQQEPAVDHVLPKSFCFHIRTSYMQGKAAPLRDVACPPVVFQLAATAPAAEMMDAASAERA